MRRKRPFRCRGGLRIARRLFSRDEKRAVRERPLRDGASPSARCGTGRLRRTPHQSACRLTASPRGEAKAPPQERRRGGTSRTPSPTGWCENAGAVRRPREGQAPPLRARTYPGAKPGAPHPPQCAHWGTFPSRGRQTGRRGRRPLRGECEAVGRVRISGTSRAPSPTGWCENAGVVRRPREGQAPPLRGECEAVRFRRRGGRPRPPADAG